MSSYTRIYIHYVFSTKNREPLITHNLENRLWAYMAGIAKENNMEPIAINGIEDHVHVLLSLPSTITISQAVKLIKGSSSRWIHQTFSELQNFAWQIGYGAFSVNHSNLKQTVNYIKNQKKHHATENFKNEFLHLLSNHEIDYNEKYIWE